jgi:hypothetical protein
MEAVRAALEAAGVEFIAESVVPRRAIAKKCLEIRFLDRAVYVLNVRN